MNKCNFCNVNIKDATDHCPLCGGVLDGQANGEDSYPNVLKKEKAISFIFRLTLFISIIAITVSIATNITTGVNVAWSVIVALSFLYLLLVLYMFVKDNAGYRVRLFGIYAAGVVLVIGIDYVLGFKRWSVNFVFPGVIILINLTFIFIMIFNRRNWQSYILIFIGISLLSFVPIIMYWLDIITIPYVAQIAFGFSLLTALGTIILGGPRVKSELYRRFHILGK